MRSLEKENRELKVQNTKLHRELEWLKIIAPIKNMFYGNALMVYMITIYIKKKNPLVVNGMYQPSRQT